MSLINGCLDTGWEAVWAVVEHDLMPLQRAVESILEAEKTTN